MDWNRKRTVSGRAYAVSFEYEESAGRTPSRSREVFAADFRDRVGHPVLVEALEGVREPIFLHDSCVCRKGKETHRQA